MKESIEDRLKKQVEKWSSHYSKKEIIIFLTGSAMLLCGAFIWVLSNSVYSFKHLENTNKLQIEHIDSPPLVIPNDTIIPQLKNYEDAKG